MDWIFFGDDGGRHPSPTQHLVSQLPREDRIIWINSIGMRSPKLGLEDGARAIGKLKGMLDAHISIPRQGTLSEATDIDTREETPTGKRAPDNILMPAILPWHVRFAGLNARILGRSIKDVADTLGLRDVTILTATPVAALYLENIPHARVIYLRLDDYSRLPGVDRALVEEIEPLMMTRADLVVATAKNLLPDRALYPGVKSLYLPQGVDFEHFARRRHRPAPERPVLGFFGLFAEWIDADLIREVALAKKDWTLEFIGPRRHVPAELLALPNVVFKDAVDYADLPRAIGHWTAAWIPFEVSELTASVNPLKLREYLSAGLPTACTEMPEVDFAHLKITRIERAADVAKWLTQLERRPETPAARLRRSRAMRAESWAARAEILCHAASSIDHGYGNKGQRHVHAKTCSAHSDFSHRLARRGH